MYLLKRKQKPQIAETALEYMNVAVIKRNFARKLATRALIFGLYLDKTYQDKDLISGFLCSDFRKRRGKSIRHVNCFWEYAIPG